MSTCSCSPLPGTLAAHYHGGSIALGLIQLTCCADDERASGIDLPLMRLLRRSTAGKLFWREIQVWRSDDLALLWCPQCAA